MSQRSDSFVIFCHQIVTDESWAAQPCFVKTCRFKEFFALMAQYQSRKAAFLLRLYVCNLEILHSYFCIRNIK